MESNHSRQPPRPAALHDWHTLGGPSEALSNPSLLFFHGDTALHNLVLPKGVRRYWPLEGSALGGDAAAALPNAGMLFVVDAVPVVPPRSTSPDVAALEQKSASCRLLLSLFVLDAINWVCYKLFQARAAARAAPPAPRAAAHATLPPPSHRAAARRSF